MSKYASLPDLDSSQDVYETPDLADDVSTLPTTIGARTASPVFSDDDRDHHGRRPAAPQLAGHYRQYSTASATALAESIDRTHLKPSAARSKFLNTEIDASHVDFSDRVGGRKSGGYITTTRKGRRRRGAGGRKVRKGSESGVYYGEGEGGDSDGEELDGESEEEEETLEGRLARLRREVEELKVQVGEREEREERARKERAEAWAAAGGKEEEEFGGKELVVDDGEGMDGKRLRTGITDLNDVLETLQASSIKTTTVYTHQSAGRAEANLARKIISSLGTVASTKEPTGGPQEISTPSESTAITTTNPPPQPSYTITYAPTYHTSHTLSLAADFDLRLTNLEKILGTTHSATSHLSNLDKQIPANAIIPTLDDLSRQISILTSTNQPFVEAISRRVKTLTEQAEKLADARRTAARAALDATASSSTGAGGGSGGSGAGSSGVARRATVSAAALTGIPLGDDDPSSPLTPGGLAGTYGGHGSSILDGDRETKINALYGVLPTIQQLGPLLPSVLDRLRSLRAIHADAGRAAEGLEDIEKRQEEVAVEIAKWREALEKVEGVMKDTEDVFMGNVGKVEEWVKGLERRMEKVEALYNRDDRDLGSNSSSSGGGGGGGGGGDRNVVEGDGERVADAEVGEGGEDITDKE